MLKENLSVKGIVELSLYDSHTHELKHSETVNNLVTILGKNFIVRKVLFESDDTEKVSTIAVGTGNTAATVDDTSMESELATETIRFNFIDTVNTNVVHFVSTFAEGTGTGTIREIGLLSDSSPQKLLCRTVVSTPFEKAATDYLVVSWKLQIG